MTAHNFLILRPYGSGYELVPTERTDAPMFTTRVYVGGGDPQDYFVTNVLVEDYFAFVVGMNFGAVETAITAVRMEVSMGGETWVIVWDVADSLALDSSAFFDVLFVSKGLCAVVDQADITPEG